MGQDTEYFLKFPYGTQGKEILHKEIQMQSLASHYDYTGKLYEEQMKAGYVKLFTEIKAYTQMSFLKLFDPLDFLSVFASAFADKRIIPYTYVFAKDAKKRILDSLILKDFHVSQYKPVSKPEDDETPFATWVMLIAKEVV